MVHIASASLDTPEGVLQSLEYQAKAIENTSRIEETQASFHTKKIIGMQEEARREQAGAEEEHRREMAGDGANNAHFSLYSDLALEASGISPLIKAGKDLYEIATGSDPGKFSINGKKVNTFEDMIKGSARKGDGYHAETPAAKSSSLFGTPEENKLTLGEKFGQVSASMEGARESNTATMNMKKAVDSFSTERVRQVVNECKIASEQTLSQVAYVRSMRGPGPSMGGQVSARATYAPEMSLAQGPKAPNIDVLDEGYGGEA